MRRKVIYLNETTTGVGEVGAAISRVLEALTVAEREKPLQDPAITTAAEILNAVAEDLQYSQQSLVVSSAQKSRITPGSCAPMDTSEARASIPVQA